LLTDGSLHVWTDAIRELPNIETFVYGEELGLDSRRTHEWSYRQYARQWPTSDDYGGLEFQHDLDRSRHMRPLLEEFQISPLHAHDWEYHREDICILTRTKTQARLVEPASACIIEAGVQLKRLVLSSAYLASNQEQTYPLTPNLRSLDLTSLRSLEMQNSLIESRCGLPAMARQRNAFLIALLEKCSSSLQELKLDLGDPDDLRQAWPTKKVNAVPLLALRRLHLEGYVHPKGLSRWLATMPCLEEVDLRDVFIDEPYAEALARSLPAHTRTWKLLVAESEQTSCKVYAP
jgi:hypothetical protein